MVAQQKEKKTYARMTLRMMASTDTAIRFRMKMMTQMSVLMHADER